MGIIVQFPEGSVRWAAAVTVDANSEPASVIILPVVRIERHPDQPSDGLDGGSSVCAGPAAPAALVAFVSGTRRYRLNDVPAAMARRRGAARAADRLRHQRRFRPGAPIAAACNDTHAWMRSAAAWRTGDRCWPGEASS